MEKFSSFERVVGDIEKEEKVEILKEKAERFKDQNFEELAGKEREKTPEEIKVISLANEMTNEVRRKYDLPDFDIPLENIHIIKEKEWFGGQNTAIYDSQLQGISLREQPAKIVFMKKIFHEMLHFKSYHALQVTKEENPEVAEYRFGLTVSTRDGESISFINLNEAVTEEVTKRYISKILDNSLFNKEIEQTKNIITQYPEAVSDTNESLFDEDTFYAQIEEKRTWRDAIGRLFSKAKKSSEVKNITRENFSYPAERKILNVLIDKISTKNPDAFQNKDQIFEIFTKAMITGNILPLGKLIEKTFGPGTFRKIGELDDNPELQEEFINKL